MPRRNKSSYRTGPSHTGKMAAMPIYMEKPFKIFFSRTVSPMTLKLGRQQKGLELYKSYINVCLNDDPGLTLTYFTARSNLVPKAFEGKR